MSDEKELLKYYGEQLTLIKTINSNLKNENGFLVFLVIFMGTWIVMS